MPSSARSRATYQEIGLATEAKSRLTPAMRSAVRLLNEFIVCRVCSTFGASA